MHRAPFIGPPWPPAEMRAARASRDSENLRDATAVPSGEVRREGSDSCRILYRRELELDCAPSEASLRIGADGAYRLFVNGTLVARNDAPLSGRWLRRDRIDLAAHLKPGRNAIGIEVALTTRPPSEPWEHALPRGGVCIEGEIRSTTTSLDLRADAEWRCSSSAAWGRSGDASEHCRGGLIPIGWTQVDFEPRGWTTPVELVTDASGLRLEPYPLLLERAAPRAEEFGLAPEALLRVDGIGVRKDIDEERRAFEEPYTSLPPHFVDAPRAFLAPNREETQVRTRPDRDVSFLLDFGCVHPGHVFLDLVARGGEVVEVLVSEGLRGSGSARSRGELRIEAGVLGGRRLFRYVAHPGPQRFESLQRASFRYVQVIVRSAHEPLRIRRVGSTATLYRLEPRGRLRCSDRELERVWDVARDTLEAVLPWGSAGPCADRPDGVLTAALASNAGFGPEVGAIERERLWEAADCQRADGLLESVGESCAGVLAPLPAATLYWILRLDAYHRYYGDADTAEALFPVAQRALAWFERQLGPNGLVAGVPYLRIDGLPPGGVRDERLLVNALLVGAARAASGLALDVDCPRASHRFDALARRMSDALNRRHWDARRGLYVENVDAETAERGSVASQLGNALALLHGVAPESRWRSIACMLSERAALADPESATADAASEAAPSVVPAPPGAGYAVLSALAAAGRLDLALEQIRTRWLPMLERGARTLWEDDEPTGRLCSPGATAPLPLLSARLLGVEPLAPGFQRVRIAPQPAGLHWASGVVPTLRGDVRVGWRRSEEWIDLEIEVPPGTKVTLVGPSGYHRVARGGSVGEGRVHVRLLPSRESPRRAPEKRRSRLWRAFGLRRRGAALERGGG